MDVYRLKKLATGDGLTTNDLVNKYQYDGWVAALNPYERARCEPWDDLGEKAVDYVRLEQLTVQELSAELCRRIAQGKPLGDYHEQTDPDKQGVPGELDTVSEAKDICRDILKAAKRNGLGGCALCQG